MDKPRETQKLTLISWPHSLSSIQTHVEGISKVVEEPPSKETKEKQKNGKKAQKGLMSKYSHDKHSSPCHQSSVSLETWSFDRKEHGIPRTTYMGVEGSEPKVTEGTTNDFPVWLSPRACLQRPDGRESSSLNSRPSLNPSLPEEANLIRKDVHRGGSMGTEGLDLYPSLRAESGVNKISRNSRDTMQTEPRSPRVTEAEKMEAGCCTNQPGCYQRYGCCRNPIIEAPFSEEEKESPIESTRKSFCLMIQKVNSTTMMLKFSQEGKLVSNLIQAICSMARIQQKDLRCIHKNKELSSYAHMPVENLNLSHGDTIHLALRLKGGTNTKGKPAHPGSRWNSIQQLLSPTKDYTLVTKSQKMKS